jgi:hypothetical protein
MRVYQRMRPIGLLLWGLGCARLHKDGDGFRPVFRVWHPVTWLVWLVLLIPCAIAGERIGDAVPIRLSKFWQQNRDQLQFVTPFTDINTLRPFRTKVSA